MNAVRNLRIAHRLALAFGLCVLLLLAVAFISGHSLNSINDSLKLIIEDRYAKVRLVDAIQDQVNLQASVVRNLVIAEPGQRAKELRQVEESRAKTGPLFETLGKAIKSTKGKEMLAAALAQRADFGRDVDQLLQLIRDDKVTEARQHVLERLGERQVTYMAALGALSELQADLMKVSAVDADQLVTGSLTKVIGLSIFATLLASLCAWWVAGSITVPMNRSVHIAQTVAAGDLTSDVVVTSTDEAGQLMAALATMNQSLMTIVARVREGSESIATGTGQLAAGNLSLSQRTEEQASNLEETAATMEQLTATVKHNSATANAATEKAVNAAAVATHGGEMVNRVIETMGQISDASKRIADIIGVIDGIAFQTNILALNAAVEAARAGEQGRGFAVVASEVRALAGRSAEAAKEIKALIGRSTERVDAGSRLVADAGSTMTEIVEQVQQVNALISEISAAGREQSQGIDQVGDAIMQLDQVTQQNAALVEEASAAADSLKEQARQMTELVSTFKLA